MNLVAGSEKALLLVIDLHIYGFCKYFANKSIFIVLIFRELRFLGCIECRDDLFARMKANCAQEHGSQDLSLAIYLGVNELVLLVNLEFEPTSSIWNYA